MGIILALVVLLILLWLVGFILNLVGAFIHLLLAIAIVIVLFRLITGKLSL